MTIHYKLITRLLGVLFCSDSCTMHCVPVMMMIWWWRLEMTLLEGPTMFGEDMFCFYGCCVATYILHSVDETGRARDSDDIVIVLYAVVEITDSVVLICWLTIWFRWLLMELFWWNLCPCGGILFFIVVPFSILCTYLYSDCWYSVLYSLHLFVTCCWLTIRRYSIHLFHSYLTALYSCIHIDISIHSHSPIASIRHSFPTVLISDIHLLLLLEAYIQAGDIVVSRCVHCCYIPIYLLLLTGIVIVVPLSTLFIWFIRICYYYYCWGQYFVVVWWYFICSFDRWFSVDLPSIRGPAIPNVFIQLFCPSQPQWLLLLRARHSIVWGLLLMTWCWLMCGIILTYCCWSDIQWPIEMFWWWVIPEVPFIFCDCYGMAGLFSN